MSSRLTKTVIDEISRNIMETDLMIQKNLRLHRCQHRLVLIGTTGNGKSSLANLIIGQRLKIDKNRFDDMILTSSHAKFTMGSSMNPETTVPNVFYDKIHDILICDPPGFKDNRLKDHLQDIINAFAINELFTVPCKVSILLVTSADEINISGGRGENFIEKIEQLSQMIPDKQKLKQCLGLVVSRPRKALAKYLESLTYSNNPVVKEWSQFFLNEIDFRVFGFPEPPESEIGNYYQLNDKEKIFQFVNAASIENPIHKVILSGDSLINLMKIIQHVPKIDEILYELSNMIKNSIKNITNQEELAKWECFKNKLDNNIVTITQLINVIIKNIVSPEKYINIIKKFRYLQSIYLFLSKIEQFQQYTKDFNINKQVNILHSQLTDIIEIGKTNISIIKTNNERKKLNQQIIQLQIEQNKTKAENNKLTQEKIQLQRDKNKTKAENNKLNLEMIQLQRNLRENENRSQFYIRKNEEIEKKLKEKYEKEINAINEAHNQQNQVIERLASRLEYYEEKERKFGIADCIPVFGYFYKLGWKLAEFLD